MSFFRRLINIFFKCKQVHAIGPLIDYRAETIISTANSSWSSRPFRHCSSILIFSTKSKSSIPSNPASAVLVAATADDDVPLPFFRDVSLDDGARVGTFELLPFVALLSSDDEKASSKSPVGVCQHQLRKGLDNMRFFSKWAFSFFLGY